jgi:hypothetical protein
MSKAHAGVIIWGGNAHGKMMCFSFDDGDLALACLLAFVCPWLRPVDNIANIEQ